MVCLRVRFVYGVMHRDTSEWDKKRAVHAGFYCHDNIVGVNMGTCTLDRVKLTPITDTYVMNRWNHLRNLLPALAVACGGIWIVPVLNNTN